jgi:hypothetical protein
MSLDLTVIAPLACKRAGQCLSVSELHQVFQRALKKGSNGP